MNMETDILIILGFRLFHADNVMLIFYKLAVTMQDNVILFT